MRIYRIGYRGVTVLGVAAAVGVQGFVADSPKMVEMPPAGAFVVPVMTTSGGSWSNSQTYHVMNPNSEAGEVFDASAPSVRKPDQAQLERPGRLADKVSALLRKRDV